MEPLWLRSSSSGQLKELIRKAAASPQPESSEWFGWCFGFGSGSASEVAYMASHDPARLSGCAALAMLMPIPIVFRLLRVATGTNVYPDNMAGHVVMAIHLINVLVCSPCAVCYLRRVEMLPTTVRMVCILALYLFTAGNLVQFYCNTDAMLIPEYSVGYFDLGTNTTATFRLGYWFGASMIGYPVIASLVLRVPLKHLVLALFAQSMLAFVVPAAGDVLILNAVVLLFGLCHENSTRTGNSSGCEC